MIQRAKQLRKNATAEERKLWYEFLRRHPARFRRQQPIDHYIVDFYCPAARLVIELDGGGHYQPEQIRYDAERDAYLREQGLRVLRFSNLDIRDEFLQVCEMIDREVHPLSLALLGSSPVKGEP